RAVHTQEPQLPVARARARRVAQAAAPPALRDPGPLRRGAADGARAEAREGAQRGRARRAHTPAPGAGARLLTGADSAAARLGSANERDGRTKLRWTYCYRLSAGTPLASRPSRSGTQ